MDLHLFPGFAAYQKMECYIELYSVRKLKALSINALLRTVMQQNSSLGRKCAQSCLYLY